MVLVVLSRNTNSSISSLLTESSSNDNSRACNFLWRYFASSISAVMSLMSAAIAFSVNDTCFLRYDIGLCPFQKSNYELTLAGAGEDPEVEVVQVAATLVKCPLRDFHFPALLREDGNEDQHGS